MSQQSFRDESNWKHEPHAKHYVEDKFGKGSGSRNWKKTWMSQHPQKAWMKRG